MPDSPPIARRVLFVCAGNTCRSPMAAAIARELLGPAVRVESAGVSADEGASATRDAVQVMNERGVDISNHRSRPFHALDFSEFDLLVALSPTIGQDVRRAGVEPARMAILDIPDPYGRGLEVYRTTVVAIERALKTLFVTTRGHSTSA
jgi:protein-tyrosine-phosphatase